MSIDREQQWITGEEFGRERRRLIEAGVPDDAPEFRALIQRVLERNDYLFEQHGKQHTEDHRGQWIAIAMDGRVMIRPTASKLVWDAREEFGPGNFASRKLGDEPGHLLLSPRRA